MDLSARISDADRERVAGVLRDAVGSGRLTLTEYDQRLTAAYAAVTGADLAVVTADLPTTRPTAPAPTLVVVGANPLDRLCAGWRGWLGGSLLMVAIWAMVSLSAGQALYFWPMFPIAGWGMLLGLVTAGLIPDDRGHRPRPLRAPVR